MDTGFVLGTAISVLFIALVAYRAYKGDYRSYMKFKAPAEYASTGIMDTGSAQSFGKKELKDRIIPEIGDETEDQKDQADPRELHHTKACLILKLLEKVKKTEGIRELSLKEIDNLVSQIEEIRKGLEGTGTRYDLKESNIRMSYASSRIDWLIKSYPRLRYDADMSALRREIGSVNHRINNLQEG
jgi:hypothetical protein